VQHGLVSSAFGAQPRWTPGELAQSPDAETPDVSSQERALVRNEDADTTTEPYTGQLCRNDTARSWSVSRQLLDKIPIYNTLACIMIHEILSSF
jgi:hypothetical protein